MKEKSLFAGNRELLSTGFLLAVLLGYVFLKPPEILLFLENKVLDAYQRSLSGQTASDRLVFLDIDEESLKRVGQWPWPRRKLARLADLIAAGKPAVAAFDIGFVEEDRTSLLTLREGLSKDLGYDLSLSGAPPAALDGDRAFADSLARGPFLLGYKFVFDKSSRKSGNGCSISPATVVFREGASSRGFFEASGTICTLPVLGRAAGSGFFNAVSDADGLLRRAPLLIKYQDAFYPNLALAAVMKAGGFTSLEVEADSFGPTALVLGGRRLPVDGRGRLLVNFRGPGGSHRKISAADLLEGRTSPETLAGKIVLVGTSASGLLDLRPTAVDPAHPGTEILLNVADNILTGDPVNRPPWARGVEFFLTLGAVSFATILVRRVRPLPGLLTAIAGAVFLFVVSRLLYGAFTIILPPVLPALALLAAYLGLLAVRTWLAEREINRRNRTLLRTQDALIQSMAQMVEVRHHGTGGHIQRTSHYVMLLAVELKANPKYSGALDDGTVELMRRLSPLHDIGKVGVPDRVLLKRGQLDPEEREEMNKHPEFGAKTIRMAINLIGDDSLLKIGEDFALTHQEKWDGSGYPRGLKGEEIPLAGRLMAVADVYDALVSVREYKPPMEHATAARIIVDGRGSHFDPDVVDAFLRCQEAFSEVARKFAETPL